MSVSGSGSNGISVWIDQTKSIDHFLKRVEARPKSHDLRRKLADGYYEAGQYENAIESYQQSLHLGGKSEDLYYMKAKAHVAKYQIDGSRQDLIHAVELYEMAMTFEKYKKFHVHVRMETASVYYKLNEWDKATMMLHVVINGFHNTKWSRIAKMMCSHICMKKKQYKEGIPYFQESMLLPAPSMDSGWAESGTLIMFPGVVNQEESPIWELSVCFEKMGAHELAMKGYESIYHRAAKTSPRLGRSETDLANTGFVMPPDGERNFVTWYKNEDVWLKLTDDYLKAKSYIFAELFLEIAFTKIWSLKQRYRLHAQCLMRKCEILMGMLQYEEAEKACREALKIDPINPVIMKQSIVHLKKIGDGHADDVIEMLRKFEERGANIQGLIRGFIFRTRFKSMLRKNQASRKIGARWRTWNVWNHAIKWRLHRHGPLRIEKLAIEYQNARKETIERISNYLVICRHASLQMTNYGRICIAKVKRHFRYNSIVKIQAIIRALQCRWFYRLKREVILFEEEEDEDSDSEDIEDDSEDIEDEKDTDDSDIYSGDSDNKRKIGINYETGIRSVIKTDLIQQAPVWLQVEPEPEEIQSYSILYINPFACHRDGKKWLPLGFETNDRVKYLINTHTAYISACSFTSWDLRRFLHIMRQQACKITTVEMARGHHALSTLMLYNTNLGDDGVVALSESIARGETITTLALGNCGISCKSMRKLGEALISPKCRLSDLTIENEDKEKLGDDAIILLLTHIERTLHLVKLTFRHLGLTDKILGVLTRSIVMSNKLTRINLNDNYITSTGIMNFTKTLYSSYTLKDHYKIKFQISIMDQNPKVDKVKLEKEFIEVTSKSTIAPVVDVWHTGEGGWDSYKVLGRHSAPIPQLGPISSRMSSSTSPKRNKKKKKKSPKNNNSPKSNNNSSKNTNKSSRPKTPPKKIKRGLRHKDKDSLNASVSKSTLDSKSHEYELKYNDLKWTPRPTTADNNNNNNNNSNHSSTTTDTATSVVTGAGSPCSTIFTNIDPKIEARKVLLDNPEDTVTSFFSRIYV